MKSINATLEIIIIIMMFQMVLLFCRAAEKMDLRPLLCYSCQLTVKDMVTSHHLCLHRVKTLLTEKQSTIEHIEQLNCRVYCDVFQLKAYLSVL